MRNAFNPRNSDTGEMQKTRLPHLFKLINSVPCKAEFGVLL